MCRLLDIVSCLTVDYNRSNRIVNDRIMLFVSVSRPNRTIGYGLGGRGGRNHVAGGVDLLQIRIEDYCVQFVRLS